ncbi:MAG: CotH kinase family protein [Verrucomicrobia bacterium]|nr:CotH kinase family protein [Verrucomicrobiota bacterium]
MKTMTFRFVLLFVALASSAATLLAQPSGRPGQGDRPDRDALRREVLERFDKNQDGELDDEEREAARGSFRREGPPRLSGRPGGPPPDAERRDRGGRGGRGRGGSRRGQRIELIPKFDRDGDGILDKAERTAAREHVKEQRSGEGGDRGQRGGRPPRPDGDRGGRPPSGGDRGGRPDPRGGGNRPAPEPRDFSKAERLSPSSGKPSEKGLYHEGTLRTLFIMTKDDEWKEEMEAFYRTDVAVPADLIVDGKQYKDVGLKYRGNSSYFSVSPDLKRSINLYLDHKHGDQRLFGYKTLNLLNSNSDPTFMREVIYSHVARDYIPAFKGNFVKVVINGESWGIYSHIQQYNKDFLQDNFGTRGGVRWKIGAGGGGRGNLGYPGERKEDYGGYQLRTTGADDAWKKLAEFTKLLDETPPEKLAEALNERLDIDSALWSLALECVFQDEGYFTRGSDYNLYLDPGGRFHVLQHDGNEVMNIPGGPGMPSGLSGPKLEPFYNADNPDRPLMFKLFQVPELKARYRHHLKTITEEWIAWDKISPLVEGYASLISDEVKKDVRKHSSFEAFEQGLLKTSSDGRRTKLGLKPFTEGRREFLLNHPEVNLPAPTIASVTVLDEAKSTDSPRIEAKTTGETLAKAVVLWFADGKNEPYSQVAMQPVGQADGGVFAAAIPAQLAGKKVRYYVEARSGDEEMTSDFFPARAEAKPLSFRVKSPKAENSHLRINEVVAENKAVAKDPQGDFDDYIEIVNTSGSDADLSGKYLTDSKKNPRKWSFPKGTKIAAGGRLIVWADEDGKAKEGLHANFKLAKGGETIQLIDSDSTGNAILDEVKIAKLGPDSAFRRIPDANGDFSEGVASPNAANLK